METARTAMQRRPGVVPEATAVRPAVPACTAAAGNLNDDARRRTGRRERHSKRWRSGGEAQSGSENNRKEFVHGASCDIAVVIDRRAQVASDFKRATVPLRALREN
jgi:hypothetical protein